MREDIERALSGAPVRATPVLHDQTVSIAPVVVNDRREQPRGRRTLVYIMLTLIALGLLFVLGVLFRHLLTTKHPSTSVPVPKVVGLTTAAATTALTEAGFVVKTESSPSPTIGKDLVISENPPAGTSLPRTSSVTITVSTGPQAIKIPDLTNTTLTDAKAALARANLVLGLTSTQDVPKAANTVLSQTPAAGTSANPGTTVNLVLSSGKTRVPDVRNLPVDAAKQELSTNSFDFAEHDQPSSTCLLYTSPSPRD